MHKKRGVVIMLLMAALMLVPVAALAYEITDTWFYRAGTINFYGVTYGNGQFIATGDGSGTILTSSDGLNWGRELSNTGNNINNCIYGNGTFLAVTHNGEILTSSDGHTWTIKNTLQNTLYSAAYGNNIYIAVGYQGALYSSTDTSVWFARTSGTTETLNKVTYGNGTFITVGDRKYISGGYKSVILTSTDGTTWTTRTSETTTSLNSIIYGDNKFIAVGESGTITESLDGVIWTKKNSNSSAPLYDIVYANGLYIVTGYSVILSASDTNNWTSQIPSLTEYKDLGNITYGNNGQIIALKSGSIVFSAISGIPKFKAIL